MGAIRLRADQCCGLVFRIWFLSLTEEEALWAGQDPQWDGQGSVFKVVLRLCGQCSPERLHA